MSTVQLDCCPSCGAFDELHDLTGFCRRCSVGQCISCGSSFQPDADYRKICPYCRSEAWYEKYANQLESLLLLGYSLENAKSLVSRDNAPRCTSCGEVIKGRQRGVTFFCTKYQKCRSAKRRYRTLRQRYVGYPDVLSYLHVLLELEVIYGRTRS